MTCIVGFIDKNNNRVLIGGDSLGSNGWTKARNMSEKVFRNKTLSEVIMGSTSTFRHIDLLKYSESLFPEIDKYRDMCIDHEYMVNTFIPNVMSIFQKSIPSSKEEDRGANFLIGAGDKLFEVQEDYSVLIPEQFAAVGCGEQVAMGSLLSTTKLNKEMTAEEHVVSALRAAAKYCCGVSAPFTILSSADEETRTYYE